MTPPDPIALALMNGVMCDELRIWNQGEDFIANTRVHAPAGKIFIVKCIDMVDHPKPPKRRKAK